MSGALKAYKVLLWFVFLFMVVPAGWKLLSSAETASSASSSARTVDDEFQRKSTALMYMRLEYAWTKVASDNVMHISGTVRNYGAEPIKDFVILCTHTSNSGTTIDSNRRTVYERLGPNQAYHLQDFSMGFIHSQAAKSNCDIVDLTLI